MSTPVTNPSLRERFSLYPGQFLAAATMGSLGPLLDHMMDDLRVPLSRGGLISGGLFAGTALGIILLNLTMARIPAKWTHSGGAALMGAALIGGGLAARSLWAVCLAYVVAGLGGALIITTSWMWLSAHIKKNLAGSALALTLYFALGMITIPVVVGQAMEMGATWRWVMIVEGGMALVLAVVFAFLPLLDISDSHNVRLSHLKAVVSHEPRLLLGMLGAGFMYTGAESALNVWLPKFHIEVFASGDAWASLSVTLFWLGLVAGRLGFMPLTRRFPATRLLLVCVTLMAVFTVAVALVPDQAAALVLAIGAGLGASATYGLISSYSRYFPGWLSGVAVSLFIFSGAVGGVVLPYLLGPIASAAGFRVAVALVAVPTVACGVFGQLIHKRAESGGSRPPRGG
jgi:FHS family glucose/mannose:H+ symporter-like MFS transporter